MNDRYTVEELVAEAQGIDPGINRKLFERYRTLGLIGSGEQVGRGPGGGRGARWLWSENQRQLWLTLIGKRRETTDVRALANIPVFVFLFWGENYVSTEQVKLALETYAELRTRHRGKI